MVAHMKTTIEIADALFHEAKKVTAAEGITLRDLVEEGLRRTLMERKQRKPYKMPDASFQGGEGLQPDLAGYDWERIRDLIYGDHGV
jgi:hypothetical protein